MAENLKAKRKGRGEGGINTFSLAVIDIGFARTVAMLSSDEFTYGTRLDTACAGRERLTERMEVLNP